ncbi:Arf-Gap With Coiled-Coil, Ank Repeat And Ph Domain-Containing Protein 2 [Manis pentadactyla]|nr:Arf-Gap With Coiled-Coil, Ank Repeat And Ph Domain-Containing Protein 2 [Manis pentadactyla]
MHLSALFDLVFHPDSGSRDYTWMCARVYRGKWKFGQNPLVVSLSLRLTAHCSTKDTRETLNEPAPRKSLKVVR